MTEPERQRMLRDVLVVLALLPAVVREALNEVPEDEEREALEALDMDTGACLAMLAAPDVVTPFQPVANLCRRQLPRGSSNTRPSSRACATPTRTTCCSPTTRTRRPRQWRR
jgi:hypothetical protein